MDPSEKDQQKSFDKAKYIKNVRAKEAQINFRRNFEVDGEEISKNIQLSTKYRDRAQERKIGQVDANDDSEGEYGYLENEEEIAFQNNEVNVAKQYGLDFADEHDRYQLNDNVVRLKGLDYSLLKKELDKNDVEKKQEKEKINKIKVAKTLESIKESLSKAKKEPSDFAKRVMGVFDKRYLTGEKMQSRQVAFPIPYSYYEYEIKSNTIIDDLPSIVLKEKNDDDLYSLIPTIGQNALEGLTRIITIYSEKGKKGLKEERERLERLKQEELKKMEIEEDHDIFDDVNEELFEQNVKQSEELLKHEKEQQKQDGDDGDVFKDVKDYREIVIEEQKKEFLRQKFENILNPHDNESLKMGTRINEKRKNPFEKDEIDYYDECFPKVAPNMTQMKELREREKIFGTMEQTATSKKKDKDKFGRKLAAVERIIKEKQDISNKQ